MKTRLAVAALLVAIMALGTPGPAVASDASAIVAAVNQAVAAFNKGDMKAWQASCDSPVAIIDDFPPYTWSGPTACADWATSFAALVKKDGFSGETVTLGTPWHITVTGDRAYLVYPVTFSYKLKGKPMKESGSVFTLAMRKTAAGWRIAGWTWAQH